MQCKFRRCIGSRAQCGATWQNIWSWTNGALSPFSYCAFYHRKLTTYQASATRIPNFNFVVARQHWCSTTTMMHVAVDGSVLSIGATDQKYQGFPHQLSEHTCWKVFGFVISVAELWQKVCKRKASRASRGAHHLFCIKRVFSSAHNAITPEPLLKHLVFQIPDNASRGVSKPKPSGSERLLCCLVGFLPHHQPPLSSHKQPL